jgi:hypothetical protein
MAGVASAIRVVEQAVEGDAANPEWRFQYEGFFVDLDQEIHGAAPVHVRMPVDVSPQQFRTLLTAALIAVGLEQYPTLVLSPNNCIIDVIQRGV